LLLFLSKNIGVGGWGNVGKEGHLMNPLKDFKRLGRKNVMKHKNKKTPSGYLRTAIKVLS
jgi:hypothetical protein